MTELATVMRMPLRIRKTALTLHIVASVGWLGAVMVFLALSVVGLTSGSEQTVRGVYLAMDPVARVVLVPLAIASLVTGLVQSLGTKWGLFTHYWVVVKLAITIVSFIVLIAYLETFRAMREAAADPNAEIAIVRTASPLLHATLALSALVLATVLAVFKPRGLTPIGLRQEHGGFIQRP